MENVEQKYFFLVANGKDKVTGAPSLGKSLTRPLYTATNANYITQQNWLQFLFILEGIAFTQMQSAVN